jgi:O-acetyl-ADP-ribose deacetylase (regulator of RNase III)
VYGYPPQEAAAIAVGALRSATTNVELVRLVAFDDQTLECYRTALS